MAGYFHYFGRIITEKGTWYKLLTITLFEVICLCFSPKMSYEDGVGLTGLNIPGLVLYLLVSTLIYGYGVQIISAAMNSAEKALPDLDFAGMFIATFRMVPFNLVWWLYLLLVGVGCAFLAPFLHALVAIPIIILVVLILLSLPVLMVLHMKKFSYKRVLNPISAFKIFSRVALPVAALILQTIFLLLVLYALLIGAGALLGFSSEMSNLSNASDPSLAVALVGVGVLFLYFQNVISYSFSLKLCDITKSRLSDTEFLDDDFDDSFEEPADPEE